MTRTFVAVSPKPNRRHRLRTALESHDGLTGRTWGMCFGSVSPRGYTVCYTEYVSGHLNASRKGGMRAYENGVRNDGLGLGRGGGGIVVVRPVQLSRECARRSEGGGPAGQRGGRRGLKREGGTEQKTTHADHSRTSMDSE